MYESANHFDIVTRDDHLLCCIRGTLKEGQSDSHIRSAQEELWSIALSEWGVSPSFILGQNLNNCSQHAQNGEWKRQRT